MTKHISDSGDETSNNAQDVSQQGSDPSQMHEQRNPWLQIEKDFQASLPQDLKPGQRKGINVSSPSIFGAQHNCIEGQDFQSTLDMGNSLAKVSDMGSVIHASAQSGNMMPMGGFSKATLLKDVNVRSSANTEPLPANGAECLDVKPAQGLFKVVHGPLGSDGLPESVRLESLGDWDIENLPAGTILSAAADLPNGCELHDRAAFEAKFPIPNFLKFSDVHNCYVVTVMDASFYPLADSYNARLNTWKACAEAARSLADGEEGRWQSLHSAMQLQRDHHRNVSNGLRQQADSLAETLRQTIAMYASVACVEDEDDDSLCTRVNAALLEYARALKSSDALAFKMIGVKVPSMATEPVGEVKRYEVDRFGDKHQDEFGEYVLASDFDALVAQVITQGEVPPAEAILYQGEPGKLAVRLPHEPAPTGLGWNFHRKWELRRSAYSFEAMTARLESFAKLLETADVIIRHWINNETMRGFTLAASERFLEDYRRLNSPTESV
ncbi:hypothetical protein [Pseudomonas serbica]|uniref:hypothetical protein n=1 Tax=Pseudomonas serbica TaxID=2965074 RepID=UPI00237A43A1|nr:hypothetical protein [Pseudomonas serbica]